MSIVSEFCQAVEYAQPPGLANEDRNSCCCCTATRLSHREVGLLPLIAAGMTNTQIATELHLSAATVAHHVQQIMAKMSAGCRTELVARAFVSGMLKASTWPPALTGRRCI